MLKTIVSETSTSNYLFFRGTASSIHWIVVPLSGQWKLIFTLRCNKVSVSNCSTWRIMYFKDMYLSESEPSHSWHTRDSEIPLDRKQRAKEGVCRKLLVKTFSSSKQGTCSNYERNLKKLNLFKFQF